MASTRPTAYIVVLLIGMAVLFNIERLDFGADNLIDISSYVYVIASLAAIAVIAVPWLMRRSPYLLIAGCLAIYLLAKMLIEDGHPIIGEGYTWISLVEVVMLSALVFIAHHLAHALRDFEAAYGKTRLADVRRSADPLISAAEMVRSAFALCRRHGHPLAVVVVGAETAEGGSVSGTRMIELVMPQLRGTDLLMEQASGGHLVVVCQQTDAAGARTLIRRIHAVADAQTGEVVRCAMSCFPDDGVTFEALVHCAEDRLKNDPFDPGDDDPPASASEDGDACDESEPVREDDQTLFKRVPWLGKIRPEGRWLRGHKYLIAKWAMDVTLVLVTMPVWLLLLGVCALLIKLDSPGDPVFFHQPRTGMGGRRYTMYKLRTMVRDAEKLKEKLAAQNQRQWPDYKIEGDPRITRIGRFLRKTSLDELPQLFNVLKWDMSLVGPRPTSFESGKYQYWQTARLDVMPGITGLWQLVGRGDAGWGERVRLDIAYIERRCLWLDIQILVRTVPAVVFVRGAY